MTVGRFPLLVLLVVGAGPSALSEDSRRTRTPTITEPVWVSRELPDPKRVREKCSKNVRPRNPIVEAQLLGNGTVGSVRLTRSSGCPAADRLLERAVRTWTFEPALQDGKPVVVWLTMAVNHFGW